MSQVIDPVYAAMEFRLKPGDRLHRLVALLFDTNIDDVTDEKIAELEAAVEKWRWCGADGRRVDVVVPRTARTP